MAESWQSLIDSLSVNYSASPLMDNVIYPLATQAFIDINGIDAAKFLQGQLSCDIQQITPSNSAIGSHCNAKGRMQSSFRICCFDKNHFLLRVHQSIIQEAKAALAKYIIFSKATINVSNNIVGIGLHGSNTKNVLASIFKLLPNDNYGQVVENDSILICTSVDKQSYEIYTSPEYALTLWILLTETLKPISSEQHQLLENHLGLAFVDAGTFNEFIPQMFNYQETQAISFKKGCYTGQEIVARMHYRGNLKRHMLHYSAICHSEIQSGEPVYVTSNEQSIGNIVSCIKTGLGEWDLLINLTDDTANNQELKTAQAQLINLQNIKLPYETNE